MNGSRPLPRQAALVVNTRSRRGKRLLGAARDKLQAAGVEIVATFPVRNPKRLDDAIESAVASGAPMIIVGGGDGSLSSAVDHLVGRDIVFALLPLGTANSFARTMGIPLDPDGAIDVVANGERRCIDLGMIDADYFANCATVGIAPLIAETIPHWLKAVFGRLGYLGWAAFQMTRVRPFRLTVGEEPGAETIDAVEVRIANGAYHGGTELVEMASPESGEIVVQAVVGTSPASLAWSWAASLMRLKARERRTREFRGSALRVATDPPLPISIDGEVLARTPVTARVARSVIEIAAPRES
jgi:YegS/Rv2252/BmrU family lipid kinase